jgi:hypothetical protein
VRDGDTLVLSSAPSVRLRLQADVQRPGAPFVLRAYATLQGDEEPEFETYDDIDVPEAVVGEDGTAWLRLPRPGAYELAWYLRNDRTGVETPVEQAELQTIELTDSDLPGTIEARLTPKELAEVLLDAGG